ncbi:MAG: class I lanthipeptide [Hyphomicrobiales bacterium]
MKNNKFNLKFKKETVANLNSNQMEGINGGIDTIEINSNILCLTRKSICTPCIPFSEDCTTSQLCEPTYHCLTMTLCK